MNATTSNTRLATFGHDVLASVVVFLVALPLCLGIALACGLPPAVGIITGIVGGIIVGTLSGSPLQVSGPAAGLIVLILDLVGDKGVAALGPVVLIAGAVQLLAGVFRLGQWFRAVSPAVIHGMLTGIGVLILASQFHIMVDDKPRGSGVANLLSLPESIWKGLVPADDTVHHFAAWVGAMTIGTLVLWNTVLPKRWRIVPGPLVAVIVATVAAQVNWLPIGYVKLPANLSDAVTWPGANWLDLFRDPDIWVLGGTFAVVASAETLLCATAVDQMHPGPRTKYDRELMAQGIGNTICGVLGALPMTGVIVRSAANVEAGAKTRLSAVLHGFWLLVCVTSLPFVLRLIPTSGLAAILVYTGYKLVDVKGARELARESRSEFLIFLAVVVGVVVTDLLTGVLLGVALSALKLLITFGHLEVRVEEHPEKIRSYLHLEGAATFLRLPKIVEILDTVSANTELHVRFDHLSYIDHACLNLLLAWQKRHEATGGTLVIDWETLRAKFRSPRPVRGHSHRAG